MRRKINFMPRQYVLTISCDETGLAVMACDRKGSAQTSSLRWDAVHTVIAYKRDIYSYDLICLALGNDKESIEVNEEMQGWSELVERLPAFLPGTRPLSGWWERVAQPPFAPSVTTLFRRA